MQRFYCKCSCHKPGIHSNGECCDCHLADPIPFRMPASDLSESVISLTKAINDLTKLIVHLEAKNSI